MYVSERNKGQAREICAALQGPSCEDSYSILNTDRTWSDGGPPVTLTGIKGEVNPRPSDCAVLDSDGNRMHYGNVDMCWEAQ